MELFFDTETSGFINKRLSADDPKQAWIMQIALCLCDEKRIYTEFSSLIKSDGRSCTPGALKVHGISTNDCERGLFEDEALGIINYCFSNAHLLVAHNYSFDVELLSMFFQRRGRDEYSDYMRATPFFCTMKESTDLCMFPGRYGKYKWPKLTELYKFLFEEEMKDAHDALADVRATRRCYYELKKLGI